jgi:hypothetical protein
MSDTQGYGTSINKPVLEQILKQIKQLDIQPIFIVIAGDLVNGSKDPSLLSNDFQQLKSFFSNYYPIEMLLPAVGNHDLGNHPKNNSRELIFSQTFREFSADNFLENYNRTVYYVDIGESRLIVLNPYHYGESCTIANAQLDWLQDIISEPMLNKLVIVHIPPFPTGSHTKHPLNLYVQERNKLWNILVRNNVSIVISGHEHNYSRRIIDNSFSSSPYTFEKSITQLITGGAGGTLRNSFTDMKNVVIPPIAKHHYVILDVELNNITGSVISIDRTVLDRFTIQTIS